MTTLKNDRPVTTCTVCGATETHLSIWALEPGWAVRADRLETWCPDHTKEGKQ